LIPTASARPLSAHPPVGFIYPTLSGNSPTGTDVLDLSAALTSEEDSSFWHGSPLAVQFSYADWTKAFPDSDDVAERHITPVLPHVNVQ
jgi:hypothetical protein